MDRLLDFVAVFGGVLMLLVLLSLRRAHIRVEYSVSWLVAAFVLIVISRFEGTIRAASAFLGIDYPPLALLLIVLSVFLVVFFRFSMIISKLKDSNIALAQRVAILEFELRSGAQPTAAPAAASGQQADPGAGL